MVAFKPVPNLKKSIGLLSQTGRCFFMKKELVDLNAMVSKIICHFWRKHVIRNDGGNFIECKAGDREDAADFGRVDQHDGFF